MISSIMHHHSNGGVNFYYKQLYLAFIHDNTAVNFMKVQMALMMCRE